MAWSPLLWASPLPPPPPPTVITKVPVIIILLSLTFLEGAQVWDFTSINPIYVGDLGTGGKICLFWRLRLIFAIFAHAECALKINSACWVCAKQVCTHAEHALCYIYVCWVFAKNIFKQRRVGNKRSVFSQQPACATHRVLTPTPLSSTPGKAGRNHLNEENTPPPSLG